MRQIGENDRHTNKWVEGLSAANGGLDRKHDRRTQRKTTNRQTDKSNERTKERKTIVRQTLGKLRIAGTNTINPIWPLYNCHKIQLFLMHYFRQ